MTAKMRGTSPRVLIAMEPHEKFSADRDEPTYGIAPNRAMIDQLIRYAADQQILTSPVAAEDLFPDSTHHLTA